MDASSRLNLLLTHPDRPRRGEASPSWHEVLEHLLAPLGVQTFDATTGPQAMAVIEEHPIHLAVVDTRLPQIDGLAVLRLIQRLREKALAAEPIVEAKPQVLHFHGQVHVEQPGGTVRRIEVKLGVPAPKPVAPAVILLTPDSDRQLLQEALKFDAFSVLREPVDVNLLLDVMARALRRFHHNRWPE